MPELASFQPSLPLSGQAQTPKTISRWAIAVLRADGQVEILSTLYQTQAEAEHQVRYYSAEWRGVKVTAAKCNIMVEV
jgi:hypothetical protein